MTRRIVDSGDPGRGTDFVPVPDEVDADGVGVCVPRPAGRVGPDFGQVALPDGQVGANPHHEHLTGLESWFWFEGATRVEWSSPVVVGISGDCAVLAPPAPVTYGAELAGWSWDVEDGRPATYHATAAGSEEDPAVRHTYRTKGTWQVTVTCTWRGDWGGQVAVPCGEREIDVIEVRAEFRTGR